MQIIDELEPGPRGVYAGAVGYLDFAGNLDFCIAIRTIVLEDGKAYVQAGAGIVADSNPTAEYDETRDKARAMLQGARTGAARDCEPWCWSSTTTTRSPSTSSSTWASSAPTSRCGATTPSTVDEVEALAPARIVISPGPGPPRRRRHLGGAHPAARPTDVPILGVCLGHQAIGHAFGGTVAARAGADARQDVDRSTHDGRGIFPGLTGPFDAARYHSLVVAARAAGPTRSRSRRDADDDGVVMALRHRQFPLHGVQFHPESVLTGDGRRLLRNFLERA